MATWFLSLGNGLALHKLLSHSHSFSEYWPLSSPSTIFLRLQPIVDYIIILLVNMRSPFKQIVLLSRTLRLWQTCSCLSPRLSLSVPDFTWLCNLSDNIPRFARWYWHEALIASLNPLALLTIPYTLDHCPPQAIAIILRQCCTLQTLLF